MSNLPGWQSGLYNYIAAFEAPTTWQPLTHTPVINLNIYNGSQLDLGRIMEDLTMFGRVFCPFLFLQIFHILQNLIFTFA